MRNFHLIAKKETIKIDLKGAMVENCLSIEATSFSPERLSERFSDNLRFAGISPSNKRNFLSLD